METVSSPDLDSDFETPHVPKTCELICFIMETPSSPYSGIVENLHFHRAVKCGNPWFHQGRDMETPSFPDLGTRARHGNPESLQAWALPALVVV